MYKIFLICIFFFLALCSYAQDTAYLIQNDSLYEKITYTKKIGITRFSGMKDSMLIIQSLHGINVAQADTFISMRSVPDLLFFDQVIVATTIVDTINKDGIPVMEIIHPRIHLRTMTNYYCFAGLIAMVLVLLLWFLYERKHYRSGIHMNVRKTFAVVIFSISATAIASMIAGLVIVMVKGEFSVLGGVPMNFVYAGITALALAILQFVIMVLVVQWLQNKYKVKKEDA